MVPEEEPVLAARNRFLAEVPRGPKSTETLPLSSARDRILAADQVATIDDPPYHRSIIEGYVVCVSDSISASESAPVTLEVEGKIPVAQGDAPGLAPGKVLQVTTGSFIPYGDYGVARAWDVENKETQIVISRPIKANDNIEIQGEIRKKGSPLLSRGHRINSGDIFLLASQGITEVPLAVRPRVAIFSSGDEVIPPTAPFKIGAIWDCNQYGLASLIEEAGAIPILKGIMKDDFAFFSEKIKEALKEVDMVVISGGTVAENRDFTAELLDAAGPPGALVKGVPMRSGKPIVLGVAGEKPIVCVAGHPPEAARGFRLFGQAAIARLMGEEVSKEKQIET